MTFMNQLLEQSVVPPLPFSFGTKHTPMLLVFASIGHTVSPRFCVIPQLPDRVP
jgi:hypothetical protein